MKAIIIAALFYSSVSQAAQYAYAYDPTPFRCETVNTGIAELELQKICNSQRKRLINIRVECLLSGDDGGYVNYYAVTVFGECK